jgi:succinate-semialdehyde dehydrogenase/glutarate-semialdehyde dehydrogenase
MTVDVAAITTVCPIDEAVLARYSPHSGEQVDAALDRAAAAQRAWAAAGFDERAAGLRALAAALRGARERLAELVVLEMGKTAHEARAEVDKSAWTCEYYAEHGAAQLAPTDVETDWAASRVQYPPLGVVLAVMPWNYPVWQVVRAAAPTLMAGNAIVLKHASNVVGSALALAEVFEEAGLRSLLEPLVIESARVADVIGDPRVAAVTLTGSEGAGVAVAHACAEHLKRSVLELGGSDPFVVLSDADVEAAAEAAVSSRFLNAGQSCIAAKRFVVVEAVADAFEEAFAERVARLRVGDPREEGVDLGPMARVDLRDELLDQVRRGLAAGGRLVAGGGAPARAGAWIEPTIVADVAPGTPLATEETFGPAAAIMRVPDERAAIELANASSYGLSASVWTRDVERAPALASRIASGAVFVNAFSASDPRMPLGGVKRSGWGRELGAFGIREFVNVQALTVAPRAAA